MVNERSYRSYRTYDSRIGWLYVPNTKFRILSDEATQGSYFIRTNKSKFRSNFEFRKDKEKQRIVFLGDSYTAGTGVNNEDRFTDLIDSRFEDIECYNFGCHWVHMVVGQQIMYQLPVSATSRLPSASSIISVG